MGASPFYREAPQNTSVFFRGINVRGKDIQSTAKWYKEGRFKKRKDHTDGFISFNVWVGYFYLRKVEIGFNVK